MNSLADLIESGSPLHARISGGVRPRGVVTLSGAKNSATRLLAASLLTNESVVLNNFPTGLVDVGHKVRFMRMAGADVSLDDKNAQVSIRASGFGTAEFEMANGFPIRTTYLLVAGQIRASGRARIPYPGGCKIGSRGYDLHIMVWKALGCEVEEKKDCIEVSGKGFKGGTINFPISTVGGTENALICASIAEGTTIINNAYITPEIDDLVELLRRMGASIEIHGNSLIKVTGQKELNGARLSVMPDRIEALTWIVYALMAKGELRIDNVPFQAMQIPFIHLEAAGIDLLKNNTSVFVHPDCLCNGEIQPFELACGTHPGVISDMQIFFVLLGLIASGTSRIFDYRYPERIAVAHELAKFCGDSIEAVPGKFTTRGPATFKAAQAKSTDLRGSMAIVMAALCAEGESIVEDVHMALRGYNDLAGKLAKLGVEISVFKA